MITELLFFVLFSNTSKNEYCFNRLVFNIDTWYGYKSLFFIVSFYVALIWWLGIAL